MVRIALDLVTEPLDRRVHRPRPGFERKTPQLPKQLVAVNDGTPAFRQIEQEIELAPGQVNLPTTVAGAQLFEVDREPVEREPCDFETRAPQHRTDARPQLIELERLGDVVVGTQLQRLDLVDCLIARGEHDHRYLRVPADQTTEVEAVRARDDYIEEHEIRAERSQSFEGQVAVVCALDIEAGKREIVGQDRREMAVVPDEQNAFLHRQWPPNSPCRARRPPPSLSCATATRQPSRHSGRDRRHLPAPEPVDVRDAPGAGRGASAAKRLSTFSVMRDTLFV